MINIPPPEMPRPPLKPSINHLAHNRHQIPHIQRNGTNIKHSRNRRITNQPQQIHHHHRGSIHPHRRDRRAGPRPHAPPDPRQRHQIVARKRKHGATAGLQAGDGDEVHDGEAGEGEEDGWAAAHSVEEELGDGLGAGEEGFEVGAHAYDEDEVEEEADEVGRGGGGEDCFGDAEGGVFGFFGNSAMGRGKVVSGGAFKRCLGVELGLLELGGRRGLPGGAVGVGHNPGGGEAAEEKGEARGAPAGGGLEVGECVLEGVLVFGLDEQADAGTD